MLVIRLLAVVAVLLVAGGVIGYFVSGNPRWLRFAWLSFIGAVALALAMLALIALERLVVLPL